MAALEAALAERLARELGPLAEDAGWLLATDQPYGSYTDAISDALELVGVDSLADATPAQRRDVRQFALASCLDRLQRHYATLVDTAVGPLKTSYSQVVSAIARLRAAAGTSTASTTIQVRDLRHVPPRDYTLRDGTLDADAGEVDLWP